VGDPAYVSGSIMSVLCCAGVRMISEVQLFVGELRRITLLWDELWIGALSQLYQDVMRRLKQLESEMAKVSSNAMLSPEEAKAIIQKKHMTVLKPVSSVILLTYELCEFRFINCLTGAYFLQLV